MQGLGIMRVIKTRIWIFIFSILIFFIAQGFAAAIPPETIKIALLDCPYNEMPLVPSLSEYEQAYFAGVETAAKIAKQYGLKIEYKPFIYGKGALDILEEIPKIQQWGAHLVIGPNSSDQFMLLKNHFPNVMVLSAYASGDALQSLPKNFYSTFLPDARIIALLSKAINTKFPQKNIYIVAQADCKQCVDASKLFITNYKNLSPTTRITENKLIMDNIGSLDSKNIMSGHIGDVIVVLNSSYYDYNVFVNRIMATYPSKKMVFFSDQDNWSHEVTDQNPTFDLSYESYRIGPILFDYHSPQYNKFARAYYDIYHQKPRDAVSYLTYISVMSAIEAIHQFSSPSLKDNMSKNVLNSYLTALSKNKNWFRLNAYGIYQLTSKGEVLVNVLPKYSETN